MLGYGAAVVQDVFQRSGLRWNTGGRVILGRNAGEFRFGHAEYVGTGAVSGHVDAVVLGLWDTWRTDAVVSLHHLKKMGHSR